MITYFTMGNIEYILNVSSIEILRVLSVFPDPKTIL